MDSPLGSASNLSCCLRSPRWSSSALIHTENGSPQRWPQYVQLLQRNAVDRRLENNRNVLLPVLEAASLRPGSQHGRVRACFWVTSFIYKANHPGWNAGSSSEDSQKEVAGGLGEETRIWDIRV